MSETLIAPNDERVATDAEEELQETLVTETVALKTRIVVPPGTLGLVLEEDPQRPKRRGRKPKVPQPSSSSATASVVAEVDPSGALAGRVSAGDRIVAVNGNGVSNFSPDQLGALLASKANESRELLVQTHVMRQVTKSEQSKKRKQSVLEPSNADNECQKRPRREAHSLPPASAPMQPCYMLPRIGSGSAEERLREAWQLLQSSELEEDEEELFTTLFLHMVRWKQGEYRNSRMNNWVTGRVSARFKGDDSKRMVAFCKDWKSLFCKIKPSLEDELKEQVESTSELTSLLNSTFAKLAVGQRQLDMANARYMDATAEDLQDLQELEHAKISLLNSVSFVWDANHAAPGSAPRAWQAYYTELREYVQSRGDCNIPNAHTVPLGTWMAHQRLAARTGELSNSQIVALYCIGFDFDMDPSAWSWHCMLSRLRRFKAQFDDLMVPHPKMPCFLPSGATAQLMQHSDGSSTGGRKTGDRIYLIGPRSRKKRQRAVSLQQDGAESDVEIDDEDFHEESEEFYSIDIGHGKPGAVSRREEENYDALALWVQRMRFEYKLFQQQQSEAVANVENHARDATDAAPSDKSVPKKKKRGRKPAVPNVCAKRSCLAQEQVDDLSAMGFIWTNEIGTDWIMKYRHYQAHVKRTGNPMIGSTVSKKPDGTSDPSAPCSFLVRWCSTMRALKRNNNRTTSSKGSKLLKLSPEKQTLLDRLGFCWEFEHLPPRIGFEQRFAWLVAFKEEHGHTRVPQTHPQLGIFVKDLRKRKNTLSEANLNRLNALGFEWRIRPHRGGHRQRWTKQQDSADEEEKQAKPAARRIVRARQRQQPYGPHLQQAQLGGDDERYDSTEDEEDIDDLGAANAAPARQLVNFALGQQHRPANDNHEAVSRMRQATMQQQFLDHHTGGLPTRATGAPNAAAVRAALQQPVDEASLAFHHPRNAAQQPYATDGAGLPSNWYQQPGAAAATTLNQWRSLHGAGV